ncbi:MAG: HEPN domain-containing protein, partial [Proteobacteria bacterium]|nr:HEPN domain-containing protein [Pseudomonadota bacterium]
MASSSSEIKAEITELLSEGRDLYSKIGTQTPDLHLTYQRWYTRARMAVEQLLPARLDEFERCNESYDNDGHLRALTMTAFFTRGTTPSDQYVKSIEGIFSKQVGILDSTLTRVDSVLGKLRFLLQADMFDSELDAASHLLEKGHVRAAGAVAGVVLEGHLKTLCDSNNVEINTDKPTLGYLIKHLSEEGTIDEKQTAHLTYLNKIRILCDHDKDNEPTSDDALTLIDQTEKIMKT